MQTWKMRLIGCIAGFSIGWLMFVLYQTLAGFFTFNSPQPQPHPRVVIPHSENSRVCFSNPEVIISAIKSDDVAIRREMYCKLRSFPPHQTVYYTYDRDEQFPEKAERIDLEYLNLDSSQEDEAVISFLKSETPMVVVLKKQSCGWDVMATLRLPFVSGDFFSESWIAFPCLIENGIHEILVRESSTDATHYVRTVHILKLMDGRLQSILEFEEESLESKPDYVGPDWSDCKQKKLTDYFTSSDAQGNTRFLDLKTTVETVHFHGAVPVYTYWKESDQTLHSLKIHWRKRASQSTVDSVQSQRFKFDPRSSRLVPVF